MIEGSVMLIAHQSMYRQRTGLVVVSKVGADGLADGDELGEVLADGDREAEGEIDALIEADGLADALGDLDDDGEIDALSEALGLADALGLAEALGEALAEGEIEVEAEGDTEAEGDSDGLTDADGLTEADGDEETLEDGTGDIRMDIPSGKGNGFPFGIGPTCGDCVLAAALNVITGLFPNDVSPAYTSAMDTASPATR